jgi:hypothetical protein
MRGSETERVERKRRRRRETVGMRMLRTVNTTRIIAFGIVGRARISTETNRRCERRENLHEKRR